MKRMKSGFLVGVMIMSFLILLCFLPGMAGAEKVFLLNHKNYVLPDESEYNISDGKLVGKTFFYGSKSMGSLCIVGDVDNVTTYDGFNAFGIDGVASIYYRYSGDHRQEDVKKWYVDDDAMGKVNGYDFGSLFKGVGHGCIIIERSSDGKNWDKIQDPILNYFTEEKDEKKSLIYNIPEDEIKNGCYYRVIVAYRFCKKLKDGVMYIGDQYEYRKCIEEYTFYVCSEKNYVTINDMGNGYPLQDQASTDTGFMIRKNGSKAVVTVQGLEKECCDFDCFTDPGEYVIYTTTILGHKYKKTITVTNGIDFAKLKASIHRCKKDDGFTNSVNVDNTVFGGSLTSLSLAVPKGIDIVQSDNKYGINGKSIALYLKINKNMDDMGLGWVLNSDPWGKNTKEKINGIETGEIGKGALIIQRSYDGKKWEELARSKYAKGLYTTDYATNYGNAENVLIYTPGGNDILNGIYIRVWFAYQVFHGELKDYRDYLETYDLYLCNNEINSVTFHNNSAEKTVEEMLVDEDTDTVNVYKQAETLKSGSYTVTGFRIDKSLNPTVNISVSKDGMPVTNNQMSFDTTGRYDISLTSPVGTTSEVTIYVDRASPEEAMKQYFGDGFISGKRIFSEGEYPLYEGGVTTYYVAKQEENVYPLYGKIINLSSGSEIIIEQNNDEKSGVISEPGTYKAVLSTSKDIFEDNLIGDARVFTFQFSIIQQGSAPGPVVNKQLLSDYSHSTVVDSNPVYYGLTYSSAERGNITTAFATKEAAVEYAYHYEKGTVELQEDGTYRYTGSFIVDQKTKFDSAWDLTDAVNYFADSAVHKHYFDLSDEFTYLSLSPELIESTSNLRQLELTQSVTIFGENQKEELTDLDVLPLINDKPYSYYNPATHEVSRGYNSFEFITDQYGGIDSKSVTITDSEGGQHMIRYSESVGQQLLADNCPSGIVTIHEETMYGDSAEYQAVYIAPGDNTTEMAFSYTKDGEKKTVVKKQSDAEPEIIANEFTILGLRDQLDPYAFVIVKHNQKEEVYTAKDQFDTVWKAPGKYTITCMNRMGYGYTIPIEIEVDETMEAMGSNLPEDAEQATETPLPIVTVAPTTEEPASTDTAVTEQPEQSPISEQIDIAEATEAPAEQSVEVMEQETDNNHSFVVVIAILAGLALIAGLGVLVYRRGKLYSRMTDAMKSKEEDKNA